MGKNNKEINPAVVAENLTLFKLVMNDMIATSQNGYKKDALSSYYQERTMAAEYTLEEAKDIINNGDIGAMSLLSNSFFRTNGYYKQLLIVYASLLNYAYVVIPHLKNGVVNGRTRKKYMSALDLCENLDIKKIGVDISLKVLLDGEYFGIFVQKQGQFSTLNLPEGYCQTRYKGFSGIDLVELDLNYFNTITDKDKRKSAFKIYPSAVKKEFDKYNNGTRSSQWYLFDEGIGIYCHLYDERPFFLNSILSIMDFENFRNLEMEKEDLETKKILIQTVPLDNEGELVFEPDEIAELHRGATGMLANNKKLDVLTTPAKVTVESLSDSRQAINSNLETFQDLIYSNAGVSKEVLSATGNISLTSSLQKDLSIMMVLANQFSVIITTLLNITLSDANHTFSFVILPISYFNASTYIADTSKLAALGYSSMLPQLATGLSQRQFIDLKILENDILDMNKILIPLSSAYTQSGKENVASEGGRPTLPDEKKTDKTIINEGG